MSKIRMIAGVDGVGCGPLAGPVVAGAVILDAKHPIDGLKDSKLLSALQREKLVPIIQQSCLAWSIGRASVDEIDTLNILHATLLAMQRAIEALPIKPQRVLVDGVHLLDIPYPQQAIIDGDKLIPAISAASIIAKVVRDQEMIEYDKTYPDYGFAQHKGYGTKQHLLAIKKYGITSLHRTSFAPVKKFKKT